MFDRTCFESAVDLGKRDTGIGNGGFRISHTGGRVQRLAGNSLPQYGKIVIEALLHGGKHFKGKSLVGGKQDISPGHRIKKTSQAEEKNQP